MRAAVSFRGRLTLFFLLIVVLPMIAVGILVTQVTAQSGNGKADARLAAALDAALALYRDDVTVADRAGRGAAQDPALSAALRSGDRSAIGAATRTVARAHGLESLVVRDPSGRELASAGSPDPVADYTIRITGPGGGNLAEITASTTTATAYLTAVRHLTGRNGAVLGSGGTVSANLNLESADLPPSGDSANVGVAGETLRAATADLPGPGALRLTLFGPTESGGFFSSSPLVGLVLAIFFGIALAFVGMLLRALGGQVATMLQAARRIGEGDFSREVPVVGNDEMAGLASEFNKMSGRLSEQMEELRRQQVEIDRSVRRIGEAFASGLDRQTLLQVVAETALSSCAAQYGTIALTGREGAEAEAGKPAEDVQNVAVAAEGEAVRKDELVMRTVGGVCALASPLRRLGEQPASVGVMTVARKGEPFTPGERDVFVYLVGQVSASIENIALHELVSEQAVTDELTGLSNNRRFRELIDKEAARAQRFGHDLSLIILDIDDFKQVNDTYGHLQGDEVLRVVGQVLDLESRGVDEPARYGGEEFAVALPETGLTGALEVAERVRTRIESERIQRVDGDGTIQVTASVGAAANGGNGNARALIAAADAALYEAKRAGKNRVAATPAAQAT